MHDSPQTAMRCAARYKMHVKDDHDRFRRCAMHRHGNLAPHSPFPSHRQVRQSTSEPGYIGQVSSHFK